jgi:hypothetical protein
MQKAGRAGFRRASKIIAENSKHRRSLKAHGALNSVD